MRANENNLDTNVNKLQKYLYKLYFFTW